MKNINLKVSLWIVLIIAVIVFAVSYLFSEKPLHIFQYIIHSLSTSVSVIVVIAFLFDRYFWKLAVFKGWFVLIPNLNGKWKGSISSEWINPDIKEKAKPRETSLSIKQSLSNISCIMNTKEMKSNSITSDFRIDTNNQILELSYIYRSEPNANVRERSQIHYGAIVFDILELKKLKGNYWSDRKTTGTIELKKE
jgi:hypothetical protein